MRACLAAVALFAVSVSAASPHLADHSRTPGVRNPEVTQATIRQTICRRGWTKTIRPPVAYTRALKRVDMRELGLHGRARDYELDHYLPLELGGDPRDPRNLWPQPWPEARKKDVVESWLRRQVCSGALSLAEAQRELVTDWFAVYETLEEGRRTR